MKQAHRVTYRVKELVLCSLKLGQYSYWLQLVLEQVLNIFPRSHSKSVSRTDFSGYATISPLPELKWFKSWRETRSSNL